MNRLIPRCTLIALALLVIVPGQTGASTCARYRFQYRVKMDLAGRFLGILPYRFYFEAGAGILLIRKPDPAGGWVFVLHDIPEPGYLMSSGGRLGNTLYFFTADRDEIRALRFRKARLKRFRKHPYYGPRLDKVRRRPMRVLSIAENLVRLRRLPGGKSGSARIDIPTSDSHSGTWSHIYPIMAVLWGGFNHSLPESPGTGNWTTGPLDLTRLLNKFSALASEGSRRYARFHQRSPFLMTYRRDASEKRIEGTSRPNMPVRGAIRIKLLKRVLAWKSAADFCDSVTLVFKDASGRGGRLRLRLYREGSWDPLPGIGW